jgi:hypothetical protein
LQRPAVFCICFYVIRVGTDKISASQDLNFLSEGLSKVPHPHQSAKEFR